MLFFFFFTSTAVWQLRNCHSHPWLLFYRVILGGKSNMSLIEISFLNFKCKYYPILGFWHICTHAELCPDVSMTQGVLVYAVSLCVCQITVPKVRLVEGQFTFGQVHLWKVLNSRNLGESLQSRTLQRTWDVDYFHHPKMFPHVHSPHI